MEFTKLDIFTTSENLEPLAFSLSELGAAGFEFHDAADFSRFLESGVRGFDYVGEELEPLKTQKTRLTLYLTTDAQGQMLLSDIKAFLAAQNLAFEQGLVREEDWENCWKEYFKPFELGKRLLIKPTWEELPKTDRIILEIDPASAFGTGQHETTKLCLELLDETVTENCAVLDLGCGSGILSIAALLLGAKNAVLVDVSENALRISCENMAQNGFSAKAYKTFCGDITEDEKLLAQIGAGFGLITANIVADVIIKMSGIFPRLLSQNGVLLVSGIIDERLSEVLSALEQADLKIQEIRKDNGWCAAVATRN